MRNFDFELASRVEFIQKVLRESGCTGLVFGNSGGKDSALAGILCKKACADTVGIIMPCGSQRNYREDTVDALAIALQYAIDSRTVDLTAARDQLLQTLGRETGLSPEAAANLAPRLRMTALYAIAASERRLVVGTGNRSELYLGYFTKWGDGGCDLNPIADLTATEVLEFLGYLNAPKNVLLKPPSAGLFDGQTDEQELGVTYAAIDGFLLDGAANERDRAVIDRHHAVSEHKRHMPLIYGGSL